MITEWTAMDQFGRPGTLTPFAASAVILIAAIGGSVWPPRGRSVSPPVDSSHANFSRHEKGGTAFL